MKRVLFIVPVLVFLLIAASFAFGLGRDPSNAPSTLIDQPTPVFDLAPSAGFEKGFSTEDLGGEVALVNIFGSWCIACEIEHPVLMDIAAEDAVAIFGIDWKDKPGAGTAWLERRGNPYTLIGDDATGRVAIDFGVTGAPETFVIDKAGRIRHKHIGPISENDWRTVLKPMIEELNRAPAVE